MKKLLLPLLFLALIVAGCDSQTEQEKNQPLYPTMWSPVGKVYIYEETWDKSPAEDKYWVWVLNFFTEDSLVRYETPNRDLSYHECAAHTIDSLSYSLKYPKLFYMNGGYDITLTFQDTLTVIDKGNDITYSLIF